MEDLLMKIQEALDDIEYAGFCLEEQEIWDEANRIARAVETINSCLNIVQEKLEDNG